jgi:ubiquinone/menaquinone biosynthesis C-methylase UbiE
MVNPSQAPRRRPRWLVRAYYWLADRFYHELAWLFDTATALLTLGRMSRWRQLALNYLPNSRVLDIGCGSGDLLLELSTKAVSLFGLDISRGMQRVMTQKVRRREKDIHFILGSAERQPFVSNWFHAVVITFPTMFVFDRGLVEEVARILIPAHTKPSSNSGRWVIVGLCLCSDKPWIQKLLCTMYDSAPEKVVESFSNLAEEEGFRVETIMHETGFFKVPVIVAEKTGS